MHEEKKLGMFNIYGLGVGGAIGSGIFVMMASGIAYTGRSVSLALMLGCVYMVFCYMYQPIMSSMFVLPGGDYDMKVMLCGPVVTGISALLIYVDGCSFAALPMAMVDYAGMIWPGIIPYKTIVAIAILTLFFAASIKGSKFMADINGFMTVIMLAAIALFVAAGLPKIRGDFFSSEGFFRNGAKGFIQAIAIMCWACTGTTAGPVSMMGVTKNPRRTIPKAIGFVVLTVATVYGLLGAVASGVLPVEEAANVGIADVAKVIFPEFLYVIFILGGAVFAIATSLASGIAMMVHPCERVADDGWMPNVFKRRTKNGYPYVVLGFFYLMSVLPLVSDFSLDAIISLVMVPYMLLSVYLNLSLLRLVKKYPEQWKNSTLHMPMPVFFVLCVLSALCAFSVAYNLFIELGVKEMITTVVVIIVCIGLSVSRLKTGAVKAEELNAKKEEIASRALALTEEEN